MHLYLNDLKQVSLDYKLNQQQATKNRKKRQKEEELNPILLHQRLYNNKLPKEEFMKQSSSTALKTFILFFSVLSSNRLYARTGEKRAETAGRN